MTDETPHRRAHRAGVVEGIVRTDADLHLINDAASLLGPPPVVPVVPVVPPPPRGRRGLAVPLFHAAVALAYAGGDDRERVVGTIYALWALYAICTEE